MSFTSLEFAVFFTLFVALYYLCRHLNSKAPSAQQVILLAASLFFYASSNFRFMPFLLYVIAVTYLAGFLCKNRASLFVFIVADLTPLLFFKYSPLEWRFGTPFPLGLSFFTFQSLSYIADCYKNKIQAERSLITTAQFVSFFPVISCGPIQRPDKLIPQLKTSHKFDYENITNGMKLFAWGLLKKVYLADKLAVYIDFVYENPTEKHGLAILLATMLYSIQIYCDFSGYSDMAIGAARILGFDAGKNFDHPYMAQSVGDFWRRWHISLSSWLRDYVYIPLGGSRVAVSRIYVNLLLTFLVSGIWHGSTWNFVIWGLLHGVFLCVERATKKAQEKIKAPAALKIITTFFLVSFAWIFFRTRNLNHAFSIIKGLSRIPSDFANFANIKSSLGLKNAIKCIFSFDSPSFGYLKGMGIILGCALAFIATSVLTSKKDGLKIVKSIPLLIRWFIYILLTILILESSTKPTTFIYQIF